MQRQLPLEYNDMEGKNDDQKPKVKECKTQADRYDVSVWVRANRNKLQGLTRQDICDRIRGAIHWDISTQQLVQLVSDFRIKLTFPHGGSKPNRVGRVQEDLAAHGKELAELKKQLELARKDAALANERCASMLLTLCCVAKVALSGQEAVAEPVVAEVREIAGRF